MVMKNIKYLIVSSVILISSVVVGCSSDSHPLPEKDLPSPTEAPYAILIGAGQWLTDEYELTDDTITFMGYWHYTGGWKYVDGIYRIKYTGVYIQDRRVDEVKWGRK